MKLLEVVRIPETSEETFEAMVAWGKVGRSVPPSQQARNIDFLYCRP